MNGKQRTRFSVFIITLLVWGGGAATLMGAEPDTTVLPRKKLDFPQGTATPSEVCGSCHKAIYREFAYGFGSDIHYRKIPLETSKETGLSLPENVSSTATSHAVAGVDPFPIHARDAEMEGKSCNVCHFPEAFTIPDLQVSEIYKPKSRPKTEEAQGLTCASCHLTPEGKIRGPYNLWAPHEMTADVTIKTSRMCAYCHSLGKRLVGKQTQTFLEWRDDFYVMGLGSQNCQDCHMPRTVRKLTEDTDTPPRVVARHLWTGGRSLQRLQSALSQVIVQPQRGSSQLEFHVINIGAGHSVPTGSNRRAIYLQADVLNHTGKTVARREWMFAPWYGDRPDDRKYLEEDKGRADAKAAMQADAQGPHEMVIRAGEERVLSWAPELKAGEYTVRSRLMYDLNRYNDKKIAGDQTLFNTTDLKMNVK